jgi:8-oxo-dGTP diphosphatase
MKVIRVAVGIVINPKGEVLLARRPIGAEYGGFWEFPGGKVEPDETVEEALVRELKEEIGIEVKGYQWLVQVMHQYPSKHVELNVWIINDFGGQPQGLEGQTLQWIMPAQLKDYSFLTANDAIIKAYKAWNDDIIKALVSRVEV